MPISNDFFVRDTGFHFSKGLSLPATVTGISSMIEGLAYHLSNSTLSGALREYLILQGRPVGSFTVSQLAPLDACPAPPASPRTQATILKRLQALNMPDSQWSAGRELRDSLEMDEFDVTASIIQRLEGPAPAIVDALMQLDLATARRLLNQHIALPISKREVDQLLATLTGLRFVYMLRVAAMACGSMMRRPTGFWAIDDLGHGSSPRYGPVLKEFGRQHETVTRLLEAYVAGTSDLSGLKLRDRRFVENTDLEQQARSLLIVWRQEHDAKLEELLSKQVKYIRRHLRKLSESADKIRKARSPNERLANGGQVKPLAVLYNLARVVVSVMRDVVSGDAVRGPQEQIVQTRGLNAILDWAARPVASRGDIPLPHLHRNLRIYNNDVFSIMRFAMVQDEAMFPMDAQQKLRVSYAPISMTSQAVRIRMGFPPLPFEEIFAFHSAGTGETDVSRDAQLHARAIAEFSPAMRNAVEPWIEWVVKGL